LHTSTSFLPDQLAVAVSGAMTPFYFAENDWGVERQRGHENKLLLLLAFISFGPLPDTP
jgi:hypothetical protein